jgi:glycosyltransferase involved in cell wall biosynthesis
MKPLVSVIITAYNAGGFLDTSIASALSQSLENLEVIVVDDGSTDDTPDRLKSWSDPRLRVIRQANQGIAAAYNTGIRAAQGSYIGFLDADDAWLPDKLSHHLRFLDVHPELDATFSWVRVIDGCGREVHVPRPHWRGAVSFSQLLVDFTIRTMSTVVMRRTAAVEAGLFDSRFVRCVDFEFLLRVALLRPDNFHAVPEELSLYRRHDTQRTRDWRLMRDGWNQVVASVRPRARAETARVENLAASNMHRYYASLAYENGSFRDALQLMLLAFALCPGAFLGDLRNWKMGAAVLAGLILPQHALFALERLAGFERSSHA